MPTIVIGRVERRGAFVTVRVSNTWASTDCQAGVQSKPRHSSHASNTETVAVVRVFLPGSVMV